MGNLGVLNPGDVWMIGFYALWVGLWWIAKKLIFRSIRLLAEKTRSDLDDLAVDALDFPVTLLIFVSGVVVCQHFPAFSLDENLRKLTDLIFKLALILSGILFFDKFTRGLIQSYSSRVEVLRSSGALVQEIARLLVLGLGLLILLGTLGVSITPIVASLGIGSLAVALGLQPTLENFFAGIQILTDRIIQVEQFIRLDTGEEGFVEKIGWRSTWIRLLPNNMVIVPNKVLVNQKVLNYDYPQQELAVLVNVGVSYDSDLEHVERVTREVAEDVLKTVPGGVPEFKPFIRFHTFGDSSIGFTTILRAKSFVDQYLVKHEFIKRLTTCYKREGIVVPFPIRTLDLKPGTVEALRSVTRD